MSNYALIPLQIFSLLYAIVIHESAHGYAAFKMGDKTAYYEGRLTLNPIKHIDPFGTIMVPGLLILLGAPFVVGWAKPVPVNPANFRDYKKGELLVSLAGPGANLASAIVFTILYHLITPASSLPTTSVALFLFMLLLINIVLCAFNLLPIPPLDGSHVLQILLPERWARKFRNMSQYGFIIVIGLIMLGAVGMYLRFVMFFYSLLSGLPLTQILGYAFGG
ncbi:MAG: site-2 protease family protein [Candidatus Mcinerneyibacterium aminivorans]|uniref:Site-2 protease family protein n=1 Tax=Candidatus Mcinerneyibacterium aminivorans TaxID=2703815 RepID=A0A5D0MGQ2_9BACT|nr:MAG: site-2 protease family protein [Candidatus Mcinerneyibacterium aminivorans]